ncbi:ferredoxin [Prochlorococcus sp. MIT 1307]|uniref:ferredoxin n=1 Tax=Prochlorococcus sp. MIT 1307 TaxID=3096219 RepID=UPI002A7638D1|nr:ferredoxin [Prochlorococcus sp. MIT 1307]
MSIDPSVAFKARAQVFIEPNGKEPCLGGQLREQAVWVDESICIGCRYCAHVATNTFVIEPDLGRSRAIRQDGDSTELIQEAIGTCPVNCIHWVPFEQLDDLRARLDALDLQDLGKLPQVSRRNQRRVK